MRASSRIRRQLKQKLSALLHAAVRIVTRIDRSVTKAFSPQRADVEWRCQMRALYIMFAVMTGIIAVHIAAHASLYFGFLSSGDHQ